MISGKAMALTLSAMALAVTACSGQQAGPSPSPSAQATAAGADAEGRAATTGRMAQPPKSHTAMVTIFAEGKGKCDHRVEDSDPPRLKKNEHDMSWDITNTCTSEKVLICAYDELSTNAVNPFDRCRPKPNERDIGKVFEVEGNGGKARLDCRAKDTGKYVTVVYVGGDISGNGTCPSKLEGNVIRTHKLGVEILP